MPFANLNGLQLHYEAVGAGPALVLLHGLGSSADDWALQVPAFAQAYRVITVDLRAHGQSTYRGRLTIGRMADDVAALLERLETPAHVVGLSLGGCVALALGIRHPGQVRSLTLVNTFAKYQTPGGAGRRRVARRLWLLLAAPIPQVAEFVARGLFPQPEQQRLYDAAIASLSRTPRATYWSALWAIARFNAQPLLGLVRCPTLVVIGDRDQTVPRACGEALAAGLPNARRLLVADSGHGTPLDQPEVFNRAVLTFLAEAARPA